MSPRKSAIPFDADEAKRLLGMGSSYTHVATVFGTTATTLRCWLDPYYAAQCRVRINATRRMKGEDGGARDSLYRHPTAGDVAARLAEIPPDTRTLTQRLMGDPIPGRDALSRRAGQ